MAARRAVRDGRAARDKPREKPQQVADELRRRIISGELAEGHLLGREPELIEQFGVSRPSLREALRILEAEGLISVIRGVQGGVVVHLPDQRLTARTAALVLQARRVALDDVFAARTMIEPMAAGIVAGSRQHKAVARRLRELAAEQLESIDEPAAYAAATRRFHGELVAATANETITVVAEMLDEVVARAVTSGATAETEGSAAARRRVVRSQEKLADLIEAGDPSAAEAHWRSHLGVVGRELLGGQAGSVIDLLDHF